MSRADEIRAKAEAEAAMAEAEEVLVAAKAKGVSAAKLTEIKNDLRAKRQAYREQRDLDANDEGTARPATIKATAGVKGRG